MTNSLNPAKVLVRLGQAGPWNRDRVHHPKGFLAGTYRALELCNAQEHKMKPFEAAAFDAVGDVPFPMENTFFRSECEKCGAGVTVRLKPDEIFVILGSAVADRPCRPVFPNREAQLSDTTTATCTWCQRPLDGKGAPKGQAQPENPAAHVPHGICFECKSKFYPPSIA